MNDRATLATLFLENELELRTMARAARHRCEACDRGENQVGPLSYAAEYGVYFCESCRDEALEEYGQLDRE